MVGVFKTVFEPALEAKHVVGRLENQAALRAGVNSGAGGSLFCHAYRPLLACM